MKIFMLELGPPGTGKSNLIAAMANCSRFDVLKKIGNDMRYIEDQIKYVMMYLGHILLKNIL